MSIDSKLARYAQEAKSFMIEAGEGVVRDDLIMRAVVAYNMLEHRDMLNKKRKDDGILVEEMMTRAHAICLIAHNFEDYPPSTDHRALIFAYQIPRL